MKKIGKLSLFDLFLLEKNDDIEKTVNSLKGTCYLLGGDGLYMFKRTEFFWSVKRVKVPNTPNIKPMGKLYGLPKIPKAIFMQAVAFFKAIYERDKTEAVLVLYWNPKTNDMLWSCPEQENSGASSEYTDQPPEVGYIPLLHTHSHAAMTAFHSGTDDKDEEFIDGYNITVGKLNMQSPEYESRVMIGGLAMKCTMSDIIDDWEDNFGSFPQEWMKKAKRKTYIKPAAAGANGRYGYHNQSFRGSVAKVGANRIPLAGCGPVSESDQQAMAMGGPVSDTIQQSLFDDMDQGYYPDNPLQGVFMEERFGGIVVPKH